MSYSRWSTSCWYTFAHVDGGFMIQDVAHFSDEELKDIDACILKIKSDPKNNYTDQEYEELKIYMKRYLDPDDNENLIDKLLEKVKK